VTIHRLNRTEFNNTVRDLLGDTSRPADTFPVDDVGERFDNSADILTTSPLLVAGYEAAVDSLVEGVWARDLSAGLAQSKVRICDPVADTACAPRLVAAFARRAWRREVIPDDLAGLLALMAQATAQGDDAAVGVRLVLKAVMLSPLFIYRVERDLTPGAHDLTAFELASRLSFFLWSSTPDDALLDHASSGALRDPATLLAETDRMLADPKAEELVDNFAVQWLQIGKLDTLMPDPTLFPNADALVIADMKTEMKLLFRTLLTEDQNALELVDADYAVLNDRLAAYYQLPSPGSGADFRRVSVAGTVRGGMLRQGGFLTLTSRATRTSPVKRGKWILENLLCRSPPPPPGNVPPLPPAPAAGQTLRQTLEAHRSNPACAGCHALMDPLGLGLENFDAAGAYRTYDNGLPIDASGELPGTGAFNGATELSALLKADPAVGSCMARFFVTYALGRAVADSDRCALSNIDDSFQASGHRLRGLIKAIVSSPVFEARRGEP
jgi:hypothetical protein